MAKIKKIIKESAKRSPAKKKAAPSGSSFHFLEEAFNAMRKAQNQSELNTLYLDFAGKFCSPHPSGLFLVDSLDDSFHPLQESGKTPESLKLGSERGRIIDFFLNKYQTGKVHFQELNGGTVIGHDIGGYCCGFLLVGAKLEEDNCHLLHHLSQLWLQFKNRLELKEDNSKLAEDLGRTLHNLSVVRSIAQSVSKAQDLNHLLSLILKVAITTVNASSGILMLEDEKTHKVEPKVAHGLRNHNLETRVNAGLTPTLEDIFDTDITGRVLDSHEAILITGDGYQDSLAAQGKQSLICVPLMMSDNAFGVIYVSNKQENSTFDREDLDVLSILASHASAVLHQARLYNLASTDELTGLYSRRYYTQRIGDEYKRCKRYQRHLSILVIDIDLFKKVNDRYGHLAGDQVLRRVSKLIRGIVRNDVDTAVRFGGEEFVVVLPETHLRGAYRVAERIRQKVEQDEFVFENNRIKITVSIGVSSYPENGHSIEDLLNVSDHALYTSKSSGRNCVTADPSI